MFVSKLVFCSNHIYFVTGHIHFRWLCSRSTLPNDRGTKYIYLRQVYHRLLAAESHKRFKHLIESFVMERMAFQLTRHFLQVTRVGLGGSCSFTTSSAPQFPKLKTHSGTKKRWTSLPNGLFKRVRITHSYHFNGMLIISTDSKGKAGHKHLNASKAPGRINRLGATAYSHGSQSSKLRKLLPYG
jgi:ribosomal protein L35